MKYLAANAIFATAVVNANYNESVDRFPNSGTYSSTNCPNCVTRQSVAGDYLSWYWNILIFGIFMIPAIIMCF